MNRSPLKRWWSSLGTPSRNHNRTLVGHSGRIYRAILVVVVVGVLTYLFPAQRPHDIVDLPVNSVTTERINAPILFYVRKSEEALETERSEAQKAVPTILRLDHDIRKNQLARFDSAFHFMVINFKMEMEDSLKINRVRRKLPGIIDPSFTNGSLRKFMGILADDSAEYIRKLEDACRQLLINAYSNGIISDFDKRRILNDITPMVRNRRRGQIGRKHPQPIDLGLGGIAQADQRLQRNNRPRGHQRHPRAA